MTNLLNWLYDQIGEDREVADSQFEAFIGNEIDNGNLEGEIQDIEVPDSDLDGYLIAFEQWLES